MSNELDCFVLRENDEHRELTDWTALHKDKGLGTDA